MIALAIITLLSSFAIPAYQDYSIKTRVAEAISLVKPLQIAVAENAANGTWIGSGLPADYYKLNAIYFAKSTNLPKAVKSIIFDTTSGWITITFKGQPIDNKTLFIMPKYKASGSSLTYVIESDPNTGTKIPSDRISWGCRSADLATPLNLTRGTLPGKYAPQWCNEVPPDIN